MKRRPLQFGVPGFHAIAIPLTAGLLLLKAVSTLNWRMEVDAPMLHYAARLMHERQLVPYRDIFDTSFPGAFFFHYVIVGAFGYGDRAFRCVDLFLLGALLLATYAFMSRFGRRVGIWSALIYGLVYLSGGQELSLQRDYVSVALLASSLTLIPGKPNVSPGLSRFAVAGFLFGMSALIRPHLALSLPIVFTTLLAFRRDVTNGSWRDFCGCAAACLAGFFAPIAITLWWLAAHAALGPFATIVLHYLPLFAAVTRDFETVTVRWRLFLLARGILQFGGYGVLLLCSLFGVYRLLTFGAGNKAQTRMAACLICLAGYCVLYPAAAGRYWDSHYMPLAYFSAILTGLCFFAWPEDSGSWRSTSPRAWISMAVVLTALSTQLALPDFVRVVYFDLRGSISHAPAAGRVDEIAAWLKSRLHDGDTVQPLDWTGGSVHAMLLANARPATRFFCDVHFHHHVSEPIIQELRGSFMSQLRESRPRFIIEVHDAPQVSGIDSTQSFPELEAFIKAYYSPAATGDGYIIYERGGIL